MGGCCCLIVFIREKETHAELNAGLHTAEIVIGKTTMIVVAGCLSHHIRCSIAGGLVQCCDFFPKGGGEEDEGEGVMQMDDRVDLF